MRLVAALCYALCILFCLAVAGAIVWLVWSVIKPRKEVWR